MPILWRPVGLPALLLVRQSGVKRCPPRLPDQPVSDPVATAVHAAKIATDRAVPASDAGIVIRFEVGKDWLPRYDVHDAGGSTYR